LCRRMGFYLFREHFVRNVIHYPLVSSRHTLIGAK
jgi:hypothetical protein